MPIQIGVLIDNVWKRPEIWSLFVYGGYSTMFNGIIEFYTKNKKINKIGFVALAICISYIVTYNMPDYFGIEKDSPKQRNK